MPQFHKSCNLVFIFVTVIFIHSNAQTKGLTEVDVDLGSATFSGAAGLPFDVPFKITGPVTSNLRSIYVSYRIKPDDYKSWMRFPSSVIGKWSDTSRHWNYFDESPAGAKFHLYVGPIHPNVAYEFLYIIRKAPSLNATQRDDLKKTIFNSLVDFLSNLEDVNDSRISTLNIELDKKIQVAVGNGDIQYLDGSPFKINIRDRNLKPITNKIIDCNLAIRDARNDIPANANQFLPGNGNFVRFKNILSNIKNGVVVLDAPSLAIWNSPFTSAIPALKDLKFKDLADMLTDPGLNWADLINGTVKIDPPRLTTVTATDNSSFAVLSAFFDIITNQKFKTAGVNPVDPFAAVHIFVVGNLKLALTTTLEDLNIITVQQQVRANLLNTFPDILADKLISTSIVVVDKSVSDVVSSSSPYIGLDYGLSYTPNYSQLFIYEGVNFYLVPVNKDARLATMRGFRNNLSKRLSIHLGLTQSLITAQNKNYVPLIGTVGSILLGAGLRFSRILRLNYGTIFFYEKDANPLIDKQTFKAMYTFSLTFDFNVAKAFGDLGTRLGIK